MNSSQNKAITLFYFLVACLFAGFATPGYSISCTGKIIETSAGAIDFGFIDALEKVPGLIQHLAKTTPSGDVFVLDNQSQWSASDIDVIKNWKVEDDLYITQNQAVFSIHRFALVNPRLQKAVPISLLREPLPANNKTFFVTKIDLANDVVTLTNGVDYALFPNDHGTLRKFAENDRVMIGFNSSDRLDAAASNSQCHKGYLLINTTNNSYVRANPARR